MLRLSRKIVLVFIVLLLTGCSATYKVSINENTVFENVEIVEENKTKFDKKNPELYNVSPRDYLETNLKWPTPIYNNVEINPLEPIKIDNNLYYQKKKIDGINGLGLNMNSIFNNDKYNLSKVLNECYEFEFKGKNKIFKFETTSEFKCFEKYKILEEVTINLDTSCRIVETNSKSNNSWNINKNNYKKESIKFIIDCNKIEENKPQAISIIEIFACVVIFMCFIIVIVSILRIKNNKI